MHTVMAVDVNDCTYRVHCSLCKGHNLEWGFPNHAFACQRRSEISRCKLTNYHTHVCSNMRQVRCAA